MHYLSEGARRKFSRVERVRSDMHDYQDELAVPFIKSTNYAALWIDLGLGKTAISLTAIADLYAAGEVNRVLVVGPIRVISVGWPDEIATWAHTAWLSYTVCRVADDDPRLKEAADAAKAEAKRKGATSKEAESAGRKAATLRKEELLFELTQRPTVITLINREAIPWLLASYGRHFPWDMVVIDESSGFKDHQSERVKAMLYARRTGTVTRMVELTATPTTEGYMGLFSQIGLLDDGERFTQSITKYREQYFSYDHYKRKYSLLPNAENTILDKIKDITLVMKSEDYLDLEKPKLVRVPIRLSAEQMALYAEMERERVVVVNDVEIEAKTAADLSNKLLQMSSGVLYERIEEVCPKTGDMIPRKRVHTLHDHKIEELERIVDALDGKSLLVAYHYRSSLDRLRKAFPKALVLDKEGELIGKWNKGEVPMLLVHPASAGHGLNLQKGGHHLVLFDIIWSLELFLQLVGRLARQGQKDPVIVHMLTALGTLDEFVVERLLEKRDAQDDMFVLLKRMIAKYRAQLPLLEAA